MAKRRGTPIDEMPSSSEPGWRQVFNTTEEVIPAWGVMAFSPERTDFLEAGADDYYMDLYAGDRIIRVKKIDEDFTDLGRQTQTARLWFNGPQPILPHRFGRGTRLWPARCLVLAEEQDEVLLPGRGLKAVADQWYLEAPHIGMGVGRFLLWDYSTTASDSPRLAIVDQPFMNQLLIGKANEDIAQDAEGEATIWQPNSPPPATATATVLTVQGWINGDVFQGDRLFIGEIDDKLVIINADCPE